MLLITKFKVLYIHKKTKPLAADILKFATGSPYSGICRQCICVLQYIFFNPFRDCSDIPGIRNFNSKLTISIKKVFKKISFLKWKFKKWISEFLKKSYVNIFSYYEKKLGNWEIDCAGKGTIKGNKELFLNKYSSYYIYTNTTDYKLLFFIIEFDIQTLKDIEKGSTPIVHLYYYKLPRLY